MRFMMLMVPAVYQGRDRKTIRPEVTDGLSTDAKDVLGGYWMIRVNSKEEAVEWAERIPAQDGDRSR